MTTRLGASPFFCFTPNLVKRVRAIVPMFAFRINVSGSCEQLACSPHHNGRRSPFQNEFWRRTFPGLKPWTIIFSRFAAFACIALFVLVPLTRADDQKLSS